MNYTTEGLLAVIKGQKLFNDYCYLILSIGTMKTTGISKRNTCNQITIDKLQFLETERTRLHDELLEFIGCVDCKTRTIMCENVLNMMKIIVLSFY
jgi:hypothetical protein